MLAPSSSLAATGPGWGGRKACITAKAPAEGRAYLRTEPPNCFATLKMMGSMTMRPASKKIGKPNSREAIPSAKGARWEPKRLIRVSASTLAPPVISRIRPIMAPRPTSRATEARVPPKPVSMVGITWS